MKLLILALAIALAPSADVDPPEAVHLLEREASQRKLRPRDFAHRNFAGERTPRGIFGVNAGGHLEALFPDYAPSSLKLNRACSHEIFFPATTEAYKRVLQEVGNAEVERVMRLLNLDKLKHTNSPDTHFDGGVPVDMVSPEIQRTFLARASQEYCPALGARRSSLLCKALGMPRYDIPSEIHAMSGGGTGFVSGGLYNADLVLEAVRLVPGRKPAHAPGGGGSRAPRVLDFGGSSGRSIAALKHAFPGTEAHLSDPIKKSIEWAQEHLAGVRGYASPIHPPMAYDANYFDLVFAISIWSHYNFENAAFEWFAEMHRILAPHGLLVITTHGWGASHSKTTDGPTAAKIKAALETRGHFYVAAFPGNVDWDPDTKNPDWGMSWVDPQWLSRKLSGSFSLDVFIESRSDCLQDVIVLRKHS